MKKFILLPLLLLCLSLQVFAADTIVLNLRQPTNPPVFELNENGYWTETYNASDFPLIEFGLFQFTHIPVGFGGTEVGGGMSYWDGFTYSTNGDNTNYGIYGSSDSWLPHQWGCMAGGGIRTDDQGRVLKDESGKVLVEKGLPYLVAYWGYWIEQNMGGDPCLQVQFSDGQAYQAIGMYVNNHPWPYYGNIQGDGFASPFTQEGDAFRLIVHGFNEQMQDVGVRVVHTLAEFKNGALIQSPDWEWIDLTPLGKVYGVYFTMESTDMHNIVELGPNTAVYFCMDKLVVAIPERDDIPERPISLAGVAGETTIEFSWSAGSGAVPAGYNVYLDDAPVAMVASTTYVFEGLLAAREYVLGVEAFNNAGEVSAKAFITISTIDTTPPTMPQNLRVQTTPTTIELAWDAASDNVGVVAYNVFVDDVRVKRTEETTHTITLLDPNTEYRLGVEALDAAGNRSPRNFIIATTGGSSVVCATLQGIDIKVYMNPATGILSITVPHPAIAELYNLWGQRVWARGLFGGTTTVDLSRLAGGVYVLRCGAYVEKLKIKN